MIMLLHPQLEYINETPYIQLREEDCFVVFLLWATMYPMHLCFKVTRYHQESNTRELSCTR